MHGPEMINDEKPAAGAEGGRKAALKAWERALAMTAPIANHPDVTLPIVIERLAGKYSGAPALLSENECLTYRTLAERANRYARWALGQGVGPGDAICLLMGNCAEYMAIWLGITRIGGIVSLVNTNLVGDALVHSLSIVEPRHIIVAADLADGVAAVLPRLGARVQCWVHGEGEHRMPRIDQDIVQRAGDPLDRSACHMPSLSDRALYIYTSGTTGLPKAANVSHFRLMQWSHWFAGMMHTRADDRMYNCLPMYHSIGGVVATGATLVGGGSVVIRQRFSASQFWEDVTSWNCTLFQYIGELCRYLIRSPRHPRQPEHRIRLCCGNGLKRDAWDEFKQRFRIPHILEYYAATEGTFSLFNCEERPGAIGRIPGFLAHRFPVAVVKVDAENGVPIQNDAGFFVRCAANEVGEAIGEVLGKGSKSVGRFEGYTDKEASDRKILRNVFVKGDAWYRTGDLMRRDKGGFFYFVDRLGDSFRWKGENVSTAEVGEAISRCPGVIDVVVYGVRVAGTEGRAGMAAVVVGRDFNLVRLRQRIAEEVPEYARPLFLRICGEIDRTSTFKHKKGDLAREGYDPSLIADPIYFNDRDRQAFVTLDAALYNRIQSGGARL